MPEPQNDIAHLTARPHPPNEPAPDGTGLRVLGLGGPRDGLLLVPPGYRADAPAPLFVLLHGAGGDARRILSMFQNQAETAGMIVLVPDSRGPTWDVILGGYGPDADFLDEALDRVFARYAIDPDRIAIGGFSDGASYGLSFGITNGDLFTHILAFSPGFLAPAAQRQSPLMFVSHGVHDQVLPIDGCSRVLVPLLRRAGYEVVYREFDGPHTVPPAIVDEAFRWFLDGPGREDAVRT